MAIHDSDTPMMVGIETDQRDPLTHRIIGCAMEVHCDRASGAL
jgi:hypothetical protein